MHGKEKMVAAELYSPTEFSSGSYRSNNLQSNSLGLDKQQRKFYEIRLNDLSVSDKGETPRPQNLLNFSRDKVVSILMTHSCRLHELL